MDTQSLSSSATLLVQDFEVMFVPGPAAETGRTILTNAASACKERSNKENAKHTASAAAVSATSDAGKAAARAEHFLATGADSEVIVVERRRKAAFE